MTRYEAKEKMYQHLFSDYDLTRSEAKDSFEMQIIDQIYDDLENKNCNGCINEGKHIALHPCSSCIRGAAIDFYQAYPSKAQEYIDNM